MKMRRCTYSGAYIKKNWRKHRELAGVSESELKHFSLNLTTPIHDGTQLCKADMRTVYTYNCKNRRNDRAVISQFL